MLPLKTGSHCKTALTLLLMGTSPEVTGLNIPTLGRARRTSPLRMAPNLLTLLRICLAPCLLLAVFERRFTLAFALFLVAACSDAADGLLARWLRQRTMIGEYLDPLADKLVLSSLFLVLTLMGIMDPRVTVLVFGRDFGMLITALILYTTVHLRDFRPSLLGKANSFSQVAAVGMVLLSQFYPQSWVTDARTAMLDATMFLTVASGFHYALVASRRIGLITEAQTAHPPSRN
jgi:cardiolipin synthase (CMP-forming)